VLIAYLGLFWMTWRDLQVVTRLAHRDPEIGGSAGAIRAIFLLYAYFCAFADLWLNPITYALLGMIIVMRRYVETLPEPATVRVVGRRRTGGSPRHDARRVLRAAARDGRHAAPPPAGPRPARSRRFEARVFTLRPGGEVERELRAAGVSVSSLDVPGRLTAPATVRALLRTARLLRAERIDVVHGYQWRPALLGTLTGRLAGVPLLLASKRKPDRRRSRREPRWRRIARHVDTVLVNADALRVEGEHDGMRCRWTLPPERHRPGRVPSRRARPVRPRRRSGSIPTAGRGHRGPARAAEGTGRAPRGARAPEGTPAGAAASSSSATGRPPGDLRKRAEALGVTKLVRFTGTLDDVRPALAAMDVFTLPSREEGMSNALMEAMAAAKPIVATDVGGNGEVLDRGRLGVLVPGDDALALADAVGALLDDAARAARSAPPRATT
jgi:glycosyltransferase involved in cell wall biosynthesis